MPHAPSPARMQALSPDRVGGEGWVRGPRAASASYSWTAQLHHAQRDNRVRHATPVPSFPRKRESIVIRFARDAEHPTGIPAFAGMTTAEARSAPGCAASPPPRRGSDASRDSQVHA